MLNIFVSEGLQQFTKIAGEYSSVSVLKSKQVAQFKYELSCGDKLGVAPVVEITSQQSLS
jgi:hypothetical protein